MQSHRVNPELELRLLQAPDAAALFALVDANRASLRTWLAWVDGMVNRIEADKFIARATRDRQATRAFSAGIWWSGRLVGVIGHNHIDWTVRISNPGWWLVPAAEGKGLMTPCCRAFFHHAFTQLQVNRIVVGVATGNLRGQAIVRRLGFTPVRTLAKAEWLNGRAVDHFIFSLLPPGVKVGPADTGPAARPRL